MFVTFLRVISKDVPDAKDAFHHRPARQRSTDFCADDVSGLGVALVIAFFALIGFKIGRE